MACARYQPYHARRGWESRGFHAPSIITRSSIITRGSGSIITRSSILIKMPEVRHSVCALDCPDTCSLLINVEDGKGSHLRGNPAHAVTRGFLCGKVARYLDREYSPGRLLYPQKRAGAKGEGKFQRISWDEALDTIAARLRQVSDDYGPEAILPYSYAGTMGFLNGGGMDRRFFH